MPTYKPEFFELALKSAIEQTYQNIEILVTDNCPSDQIERICTGFDGVVYSRNPATGIANIINSLHIGTGKYIKPLFDDDILHPQCVEKMVEAIESSENTNLVFSASAKIDVNNQRKGTRVPFDVTRSFSLTGLQLHRLMAFNFYNFVGEFSTVLFERKKVSSFNGPDIFRFAAKDYSKGLGDVVAYWNVTRGGNAYYINEELSCFRIDRALKSNSNSSTNKNFIYILTDWIDLLLQSYESGAISQAELKERREFVNKYFEINKKPYPNLAPLLEASQANFNTYLDSL